MDIVNLCTNQWFLSELGVILMQGRGFLQQSLSLMCSYKKKEKKMKTDFSTVFLLYFLLN